jgi:hypothetical protein
MSWFGFGGGKKDDSSDSSSGGNTYDFGSTGGGGGFSEDPVSTFDNTSSFGGECWGMWWINLALCISARQSANKDITD